jgi:hypothetical protein
MKEFLMTTPQAILIGAALIVGALFLTNGISSAQAQHYGGGPFQLMHHSNTVANAGVFRLDTGSGEVSYCFIQSDNTLICSAAVK